MYQNGLIYFSYIWHLQVANLANSSGNEKPRWLNVHDGREYGERGSQKCQYSNATTDSSSHRLHIMTQLDQVVVPTLATLQGSHQIKIEVDK